ncbi:MAG: phosphopantothenoylcysteine decarboxylase [Patescibacteria group bacterium]
MRVLVTAGSTETPIDQVRSIGNIFKGSTGFQIAHKFSAFLPKNKVTLLTSNAYHMDGFNFGRCVKFRTFDELAELMEKEIRTGNYEVIIHSAAVSDYKVDSVMLLENGVLKSIDASKKVSGSHKELYLKLIPTIKLIDQIRIPWGFNGKLVKFKLQVRISDEELLVIAKKSMADSKADFIVANCLEWVRERAYIISKDGSYESVKRTYLAEALLEKVG